jgi:hypothetical protein
MARGNFWEMTFEPGWDGPTLKVNFKAVEGTSGLADRIIVSEENEAAVVKWLLTGPKLHFQRCDFVAIVKDSLVSNCTFTQCRFAGSHWEHVKFSNCVFEKCDFSKAVFVRCYFILDSGTFMQPFPVQGFQRSRSGRG